MFGHLGMKSPIESCASFVGGGDLLNAPDVLKQPLATEKKPHAARCVRGLVGHQAADKIYRNLSWQSRECQGAGFQLLEASS